MSRHLVARYWRHAALLHLRRHYVASRSEVQAYREDKLRALKWVSGFRLFPRYRPPTDAPAIAYALSRHLFDPFTRLPRFPALPILAASDSLMGLDTCQQMLKDLEPYFTAKNIVHCCRRIGYILAYSEKDIWIKLHVPCLQHLCEMVDLAIPRCPRPDLSLLIWSLGKWGPKALTIELSEERCVRDVVETILQRICDDGLSGEWDPLMVHRLLNGCIQLNIIPQGRLLRKIHDGLKGAIEFADGYMLTRLIVDFSELKLPLRGHHLEGIAQSMETKLRAGTFPEKEIPVAVSCLAEWRQYESSHRFTDLCHVTDTYIMQWSSLEWTLRQFVLMVEGFVKLRYFPSWPFIERIYMEAKRADAAKSTHSWAVMLRTFAELAIRPVYVMDQCIALMEELEKSTVSIAPGDICSILQSLALLCRLKSDLFWTAVQSLTPHLSDLTAEDKAAVYLAYLDVKYLADRPENRQENAEDSYVLVLCRTAWRQKETSHQLQEIKLLESILKKKNKGRARALQGTIIADGDISVSAFPQSSSGDATVAMLARPFYNAGDRIAGSDLWRTRLCEKLGWRCRKISWTDGSNDAHR